MAKEKQKGDGRGKDGLLLLVGFGLTWLFTTFKLPYGLAPGGLGLAGAWELAGLPGGLFLALAAVLLRTGFLSGTAFPAGFGGLPLLLVFYQKGRGSFRVRNCLFFLLLFGAIIFLLFRQGGQALAGREAVETAGAGLLAWLLAPLFREIGRREKERGERRGSNRLGLAFVLLVFILYLTLARISFPATAWWQLKINYGFLFFLLLVAGAGSQVPFTPLLGLLFCLAELALGEIRLWLILWIGSSGLLPVLLPLKGKERAITALVLPGILVAAFCWRESQLWSVLVQAFLALLLFLALPGRLLVRWDQFLAKMVEAGVRAGSGGEKLPWMEGSSRLRELGLFFQELAGAFSPEPGGKAKTPKEEFLALFQEIAEANCLSCPRYELCWQERFYQTYQELFTLLGWVELGVEVDLTHLKGKLGKECVQKEALLRTVNYLMEQERTSLYWRRRYREARLFLAERLAGVAGVITRMAEAGGVRNETLWGKEQELGKALRKAGVKGGTVRIWPGGEGGHPRLLVEKKPCAGGEECRLVVAPLLASALSWPLAITHRECGRTGKGQCLLVLGPEPAFTVEPAVVQLAKPGQQISGDSQQVRMIGDRLILCILSDGMGVGSAAARISQTAVRLLEKMLAAGLPKKLALESLNTLLLLATPEEEFATLDLLLIDRFSGEVELFKVGSAPTYVKKGREVQVIRSTSLPMGIVPQVEPEYYRDFLADGDLVVMVSDGVATLGSLGEDWLLKAIKRGGASAAGPLSQYLLELAKIEAGGEINDDLTIMVLQMKTTAGVLLNNF
ncbi:MAG TPA: SpoIIE family protein phosphatase [Capillibacterium sp.]